MRHALMENRNALAVEACLTQAGGHAERVAALHMIEPRGHAPGGYELAPETPHPEFPMTLDLRRPAGV